VRRCREEVAAEEAVLDGPERRAVAGEQVGELGLAEQLAEFAGARLPLVEQAARARAVLATSQPVVPAR
jgi:hypothetical protein